MDDACPPSPHPHRRPARRWGPCRCGRPRRGCRPAQGAPLPRGWANHAGHGPAVAERRLRVGDRRVPARQHAPPGVGGRLHGGRGEVRRQRPLPAGGRDARVGLGDEQHLAPQAQPVRLQRLRPGPGALRERLPGLRGRHRRRREVHEGGVPHPGRPMVERAADAARHAALLVLVRQLGRAREPDRQLHPARDAARPVDQLLRPRSPWRAQRRRACQRPDPMDRRRHPRPPRVPGHVGAGHPRRGRGRRERELEHGRPRR